MRYLYFDTLDEETREYTYLDRTYDFVGKSNMGDMEYYIYKISGGDTILVVTTFARQFREAAQKFWAFHDVQTSRAAEIRIKEVFHNKYVANSYGEGDEKVWDYSVNYKNIRFALRMERHQLTLQPSFTIVSGNIFAKLVSVSVRDNPELMKYCVEE